MIHCDNLRPPFISCPYGISMALVSDGAFTARAGSMTESMCNLAAYIPPLFKWLPSAQGSDPYMWESMLKMRVGCSGD